MVGQKDSCCLFDFGNQNKYAKMDLNVSFTKLAFFRCFRKYLLSFKFCSVYFIRVRLQAFGYIPESLR